MQKLSNFAISCNLPEKFHRKNISLLEHEFNQYPSAKDLSWKQCMVYKLLTNLLVEIIVSF